MMNKKQFTKMAKSIIHSSKGIKNPRIMHPSREWIVGLIVACIAFITIATWSNHTYLRYQEVATTEYEIDKEEPVVYRKSLVDSVLKEFEIKAEEHSIYLEKNTATTQEVVEIDIESASTTSTTSIQAVDDDVPVSPDPVGEQISPTGGVSIFPAG